MVIKKKFHVKKVQARLYVKKEVENPKGERLLINKMYLT